MTVSGAQALAKHIETERILRERIAELEKEVELLRAIAGKEQE